MASDKESTNEADLKHHEEHEWEAQRENFIRYYKDENKTLKEATQCMVDYHGFHATPRQWERKMSAWRVVKYTPRSERMLQIESQGRSLVEVAQTGRRPRKYSNSNNLPVDDRNIRRFARRELSRSSSGSRARSRSSSAGQRSPHPDDDLVVEDRPYDLDFGELIQNPDASSIPAMPTNQNTDNPQAHVLDLEDPLTGAKHTEVLFAFPTPHQSRGTTPAPMANNMPFEQFPAYADVMAPTSNIDTTMNPLSVDTGFSQSGMFMQQADPMDLSPSHVQNPSASWQTSQPFSQEEIDDSYQTNMSQVHQSFGQAHLSPIQATDFPPDMSSPITPMPSVPQVIISQDAPSPSPSNSGPAVGEHVDFSHVPNQDDLHLADPYPDFSHHVNEYALGVQQTFSSLISSAQPADVSMRQLEHYSKTVRIPSKTNTDGFKGVTFSRQMNATLDNLFKTTTRAVRDGQQINHNLRQRIFNLEHLGESYSG